MRYYKLNKYIFTIELLDDSIHNENRNNIIEPLYAKYTTNKYKIIIIENMITNEILEKIYNYNVGDIINKKINYFLSKERAFFELDYDFFEETYYEIDKLYYLKFFDEYNIYYSGVHKVWNDNGELIEIFYHINGNIIL